MSITQITEANLPVNTKTDDYTLAADDACQEFQFNKATAVTCNLLAGASAGNGYNCVIRNMGAGTLTIDPSGAETIDGQVSAALATNQWRWIRCDGANWKSVSKDRDGTVETGDIEDGAVTTAKIAANAVDGTKIAMGLDAQGDVLYYDGTNYTRLAAGTSGQFLKTQGAAANPVWANAAAGGGGGGLIGVQVYSANATWSKPAGLAFVIVEVLGGGGSDGGVALANTGSAGGGGGGGYSRKKILEASLGATETVTVGAGGAAPAAGDNTGNTGGTSSFGTHASATGGTGGIKESAATPDQQPGGAGANGDINCDGEQGGYSTDTALKPNQNNCGGSYFGGGARSNGAANDVGKNAVTPGAGGSGATNTATANRAGGTGAAGLVIVWEYN